MVDRDYNPSRRLTLAVHLNYRAKGSQEDDLPMVQDERPVFVRTRKPILLSDDERAQFNIPSEDDLENT